MPIVLETLGCLLWNLPICDGKWGLIGLFHVLRHSVCRFGDVLSSFVILQKVTPVTHSVGNCVKRVVMPLGIMTHMRLRSSLANACMTMGHCSVGHRQQSFTCLAYCLTPTRALAGCDCCIHCVLPDCSLIDQYCWHSGGTLWGTIVQLCKTVSEDSGGS